MIEDCAQVIDSTMKGINIGKIGDVSFFSFKKYFDIPGGIICFNDAGKSEILSREIDNISFEISIYEDFFRYIHFLLPPTFKKYNRKIIGIIRRHNNGKGLMKMKKKGNTNEFGCKNRLSC